MGKLILTIGIIGLCHAAYSATQHRNYLRLTDADKGLEQIATASSRITSLPLDIVVQTLVSLLLSCIGLIGISAKFRPIKITSEWENKTWDNVGNRTSFWSFQHRGKTFFTSPESAETLTTTSHSIGSEFQIQNKPPKAVSNEEKAIALEKEQRRAAAAAAAATMRRQDLEEQEEDEEEVDEEGDDSGSEVEGDDVSEHSGDENQNNASH